MSWDASGIWDPQPGEPAVAPRLISRRPEINGHVHAHARERLSATPFMLRDPASIPRRQFAYGRHYIPKFISLTLATGGVGKSSQALVEAVAMASGRDLLGDTPARKLRVWYWNGEDPHDEIERRIAAICLQYGVTADEIEDNLFVDSGRDVPLVLVSETKAGAIVDGAVSDALVHTIVANDIDVVIIDPFVASHAVAENDNGKIATVARAWAHIADLTKAAVEFVHHLRKGQSGQGAFTVDDGRGASALKDAVRSARVLNVMTKEEAEKAGVERHRSFFRVDNGKANLAPPPEQSEWRQIISVDLGNGSDTERADSVGVVVAWSWPNAFDDVTAADLRAVQRLIADGEWRADIRSEHWAGKAVAQVLDLDASDAAAKQQCKDLLRTWAENGMLKTVERKDAKRNVRQFVEVAKWAAD
jgi:hypothetical protein